MSHKDFADTVIDVDLSGMDQPVKARVGDFIKRKGQIPAKVISINSDPQDFLAGYTLSDGTLISEEQFSADDVVRV